MCIKFDKNYSRKSDTKNHICTYIQTRREDFLSRHCCKNKKYNFTGIIMFFPILLFFCCHVVSVNVKELTELNYKLFWCWAERIKSCYALGACMKQKIDYHHHFVCLKRDSTKNLRCFKPKTSQCRKWNSEVLCFFGRFL